MNAVLVGVTTYAASFETRLILRKVLRHFRWRNGPDVKLAVACDGPLDDAEVHRLADHVLVRAGPNGVHQGELESVRLLIKFARTNGYGILLKSAGDVILDKPQWVSGVVEHFRKSGARILSTHWNENDSWLVGTKFFVADTDFLKDVWPERLQDTSSPTALESSLTSNIRSRYRLKDVARLINSTTGEAHEVSAELADWGWEHAHRAYKFRRLDAESGVVERILHQSFLYPALRIHKQWQRTARKLGGPPGRGA